MESEQSIKEISCVGSACPPVKANFGDYREQLFIKNTSMYYKEDVGTESSGTMSILGEIDNKSTIKWERPIFEVRFYDRNNVLIDSRPNRGNNFVIVPQSKNSFVLNTKIANKNKELYDHFEVELTWAVEYNGI